MKPNVCNHSNCDNQPGQEFKSTGFCGKHQQLNLANIPRTMTKDEVTSMKKIDQAKEAIINEIVNYREWSNNLPESIQEKLDNFIEEDSEVWKEEVEYMLWENTMECLREENVGRTYNSYDSELTSWGDDFYTNSGFLLEKAIKNLEQEYGDFQIKILHDGEISVLGDNVISLELEVFDEVRSAFKEAFEDYEHEKEIYLNEDALKEMSIDRMKEYGIEESFIEPWLNKEDLLEAYKYMELADQDA